MKLSEEYALEVLGWQGYAPWLKVYSSLTGEFREGWIPDNYYGAVVIPRLQGALGMVSNLGQIAPYLFGSGSLPDLAYQANGVIVGADFEILTGKTLKSLLFAQSNRVVFKEDHSLQGRGIHFFTAENIDPEKTRRLGNGVWQPFIKQHPAFDDLSPRATSSLRVTSVADASGAISVCSCYLRAGRATDTHIRSATHVRIPVELKSGALAGKGYLPTWEAVDKHPDTQAKFQGHTIPVFPECLDLILKLHKKIPFIGSIGWDLAIDGENQPHLLEWNGYHNDIKFSEATQGPCFTGLGWETLWRDKGRGTTRVETGWRPR